MTAIQTTTNAMTNAFVSVMADLDVVLPVRASATNIGSILDKNGKEFCTADAGGNMLDPKALALAEWIADAINTCGGYQERTAP